MPKFLVVLVALFAALSPGFAKSSRKGRSKVSSSRKTGPASGKTSSRRASRSRHSAARSAPRVHTPQEPSPDRYREIQQALAEKGYYKGEVNGVWGSEASDALKHFQNDQNLQSSGKLDSMSLIALGLGPKRGLTAQAQGNRASDVR